MKLTLSFILSISSIIAYSQSTFYITTQHGLSSDSVTAVVEDSQENIWVGTENGLNIVDKFGNVTQVSQLNTVRINELQYNAISGVWAATNSGLANINNGVFQLYNSSNSALPNNITTDVAVTSAGKTWCINDSNLYELNAGVISPYVFPTSVPMYLQDLFEVEASGDDIYLWILPPTGAYRIRSNQFDFIKRLHYGFTFHGGYNYQNKNYFISGNIIYEQKNDSTYIHDSIPGATKGFEWAGFDSNTGKLFLRNFESLVTYDFNSSSYTSVNCDGFNYSSHYDYRRKKALFSAQKNRSVFPTYKGLKLEFYENTNVDLQLHLGKFTYQLQRKNKSEKEGYLDTLNTKLSVLFDQDINFYGSVQGQNKGSVIPNHGYSASDWQMGPISNNYFFKSYHKKFARPFNMSKILVDQHIANWSNAGYMISAEILDWPANGNTYVGEAMNLAPFVDLNGNGTYEPGQGDYPEIPGDECLYAIYHEPDLSNSNYGLGLEVHRFAYIIIDGSFENEQTVYSHYSVINRGSTVIDSLQFILNPDIDLGSPWFAAAAIDSAQNSFYLWNTAQQIIPGAGNPKIPFQFASGFTALDHRLVSHNINWAMDFDGLKNQQMGLHYTGIGNWDSTLMQTSPYQYLWDGDSTFSYKDIRGRWGDFRQSVFLNPLSINPGEKQCYNFAFTYAMVNDSLDGLGALKKTKVRSDSLKQLWATSNLMSCLMPTLKLNENETDPELNVFPNPSNGIVNVTSSLKIISVHVYDAKGALLEKVQGSGDAVNFQMNYESGFYILEVKTEKQTFLRKLILSK